MTHKTICIEEASQMPTAEELSAARTEFKRVEPRALFYRAAGELVESAWRGQSSLSLAEAVAVLLQTWNKAFYQYRPFNEQHFSKLEALICSSRDSLAIYRQRDIESLTDHDEAAVMISIKASFERHPPALPPTQE